MAHSESTRPTLSIIRKRARVLGISIAAEREAPVLAGAVHLHGAAQRLDHIAGDDEAPPEADGR
ncbi:hypothetical protein ACFHWW_00730 [Ensifer sp. P24N7]|uniref:hypothetical protein n=1 Tax=Sinorhizobium sp. P24N7 TaxID=3348358 RepID=UPI0035F32E54